MADATPLTRPSNATPSNNTPHRASPVTPINLVLLSLFAFLVYLRLKPATPQTLPRAPPPTVFRTFTPPSLFPYNGLNGMPVYLAVRGRVFDVTSGRNFYGPGGPYANFAGRDASRGLACGSFDEDMLTKDLDGPLDTLEDLNGEQKEAMRGWEERFEEKYLVVGKLVPVGSPEAKEAST
ncbi:cytochrome b5 [Pyrenochaeta sp. DS3sAY3a]|nr:cytochrome b5 [Pyrenochaeta sp. DS3sAY3a]